MIKDKVTRALELAAEAHGSINQKRKYPPEVDYIVHPIAVASIVSSVTKDEDIIAAAYLHDVLEDVFPLRCYYSIRLIEKEFGLRVSVYVTQMTNIYTHEDYPQFNRAKRKALENQKIQNIYPESKTIKLADILDNCKDLDKAGDFGRKYAREKMDQLFFLKGGDESLWNKARILLTDFLKSV
jgi:(p)ppGpp synthase/HD superfamily hydrolase